MGIENSTRHLSMMKMGTVLRPMNFQTKMKFR